MRPQFLPICFVVMPYGVRDTGLPPPAPPRVDFDALWEHAFRPAIEACGYRAVRADQDYGSLIIKEMLERLYYSDLVVADISIANANAYYEIGVRHAAHHSGCVLIAADWARPVFDLAQVRRLPYPNPDVAVSDDSAQPIRQLLAQELPKHIGTRSPFDECVPSERRTRDDARARELAGYLEESERLRNKISAIRLMTDTTARRAAADAILVDHPAAGAANGFVACEMVRLLRDMLRAWEPMAAYIEALPEPLRELAYLQEQLALARSKHGDHLQAIEALDRLIERFGDSPERQGLLGGRYKRLYQESQRAGRAHAPYLRKAIEHYEAGMLLDLNGYFASCNLPALYRQRGGNGDETRAAETALAARLACERAQRLGIDDGWTLHTLLGVTFAERRLGAAHVLAQRIEEHDNDDWKLDTTLETLRTHVAQMSHEQEAFRAIVTRLETLLAPQ